MFDSDLEVEEQWEVDGTHYGRTARAWRENLEANRSEAMDILSRTYGEADAARWFERWRLFFLGCEELFGYRAGSEWLVAHYRFAPRPVS
jgi:cyclopropane-fatty-acyl-phospholipid synthase